MIKFRDGRSLSTTQLIANKNSNFTVHNSAGLLFLKIVHWCNPGATCIESMDLLDNLLLTLFEFSRKTGQDRSGRRNGNYLD